MSDDEKSTRLTSVLRSEAVKCIHITTTRSAFSNLIQCTKNQNIGGISLIRPAGEIRYEAGARLHSQIRSTMCGAQRREGKD